MSNLKPNNSTLKNDKEIKMVRLVMAEYDKNPVEIHKVRSAYKIIADKESYCLKRLVHGRKKAINGNNLVEQLYKNDFKNTPKFIKTKHNRLYVSFNKYTFYLNEWVEGAEVDIQNIDEAVNCAKVMAEFHLVLGKIDTSEFKIKNNLKNWPKLFYDMLSELSRFKTIINSKKIRNEFDFMYLNYIEEFFDQGMKSLDLINKSSYYKLSQVAAKNKTICHDSFYYQNILKKGSDYYIIDLDSILIDLQVVDLSKFIRRLMFNRSYEWDFGKAQQLMEGYESVKKLTFEELEIMISIIIFPHKFWKLGRKRYLKQKHWSEEKYKHKLEKIIKYSEKKREFFNCYIDYIKTKR